MGLSTGSYVMGTHIFFARKGDAVSSSIATVSKSRTANLAVIVTVSPHGLFTGAVVTIAGLTGSPGYNAINVPITYLTPTSFSYSNTGADDPVAPDTGGVVTLQGVCSKTLRPGPNDNIWNEIGVIEESSVSHESNEIEIYGPAPGKNVLFDTIENRHKHVFKFTCQEWSAFAAEVLYRTLNLDESSTQFNPLEGNEKKGWLKRMVFDQDDELREVIDYWGRLKIAGDVSSGGTDVVKPAFEFMGLQSSLNTGTL